MQKSVSQVKFEYSQSLKKLELISEEIHQKRKKQQLTEEEVPSGPREPGVGAELNSPCEENPEKIRPNIHLDLDYDLNIDFEHRSLGKLRYSY